MPRKRSNPWLNAIRPASLVIPATSTPVSRFQPSELASVNLTRIPTLIPISVVLSTINCHATFLALAFDIHKFSYPLQNHFEFRNTVQVLQFQWINTQDSFLDHQRKRKVRLAPALSRSSAARRRSRKSRPKASLFSATIGTLKREYPRN